MASHKATDGSQLMLFEAVQTANADGSFTVRPRRIEVTREIGARRAAKIIGQHVETIYRLCELGEEHGGLKAFKNPSDRGNAKWRIDWESAMGYKARRQGAMRDGG
jgi:hypothetical protein